MKKLICLVLAAAMLLGLAACGEKKEEPAPFEGATVRLGALKGPTTMGLVELLEENENGNTVNTYEFTLGASADEITPLLIKGELDAAIAPSNLAAVLYAKTEGKIQVAAATTLGVLYIVTNGEKIESMNDLAGKKIYATGMGSVPEYVLTHLIGEKVTDGEVEIEWKSEPSEIVALMKQKDGIIAMMPQPYVTAAASQVEDFRVALDLTKEWDQLGNGSRLVTACLMVRKDFADENPEALKTLIEEYDASQKKVNEDPAAASVLVEKYIDIKAKMAEKAIPFCNIVCITGDEMKSAVGGFLSVLFEQNPAAVGGSLPDEDFYR